MIEVRLSIAAQQADLTSDLETFVRDLTDAIPDAARQVIDESVPAGRVYRRGVITARRSAALTRLGFTPAGRTRSVVGSRFHRASAPGQPPAKDSGRLYRGISARHGKFRSKVVFDTPYAAFLEFGTMRMKARPFLDAAVRRAISEVTNG